MKKGVLLVIIMFAAYFVRAQSPRVTIDSLETQLQQAKNDTIQVKILNELTYTYAGIDLKKATSYAREALSLAESTKWTKGIVTSEKYLGNVLMESGQRQEALPHLIKAYELYGILGDKRGEILTLYNLGSLQQHENKYTEALEYFMKGTAAAEALNDNNLLAMGSYRVSSIFVQQHNFGKARAYAENAVSSFKKEKNYIELVYSLEIIGVSHLLEKNPEKAKKPFYDALKYLDTLGNDFGRARIYTQLVESYNNEPARQLEFIDKALAILEKSNAPNIYTISNVGNKGMIYINLYRTDSLRHSMPASFKMSDPELLAAADSSLTEAISLAKVSGNKEQLMHFYKAYSKVLEEQNQFKKAIEILNKSYQISDSLYSQNTKNKIASIESTYEIALRDKEIEVNEMQLQTQKKQQFYLLGGIVSLAMIGGLLFYQNSTRRKNNRKLLRLNQELDESNKLKARFFGILNHDLRAPVSNLIHFLHLQKENPELLSKENRSRLEQNTIAAAENLLVSMEDILLWSKGQMENFIPQFERISIDDLFQDISRHFSSENQTTIRFENPQDLYLETDGNYLKTIMRNLTGNALKVLDHTDTPLIIWNAKQEGTKVQLSITDNGPGGSNAKFRALYDDTEVVGIRTGLGLHLIRDLAKAIRCDISLSSIAGKGTTFTLSFS
ncbi:tetratricopeptide repeat-containing sensor histidine kinase [Flagellimonas amoyensis]|uniref:tetratricopeptide repeat-containing sensor histidine kinase n=1 Tax=Flagellimonas amoyensis TaxID=2169401 RepID=UPI000D38176B|nr:tetratricopeptide repeat-containing sensor histidine kinase [Allomuricauda amoyensis]